MSKAQHIDKTSAEDKSIGFDYQYYYFLYKLLNLEAGQTLGLEVMDDVHTELEGGKQLLVQLKYTTQKRKDSTPKNLTTLDPDFWKTLSNWSKVIMDDEAGRSDETSQLEFVDRTEFLLASNKSDNTANSTLAKIREFQRNEISHAELLSGIGAIKNSSKDETVVAYIEDVQSLPAGVSEVFFYHIKFDLGCDDVIQLCRDSILKRFIDPSKVDDVFSSLDSQLRSDNFNLVSNKQKIIITYDDFRKKYRIHFDKARNSKLEVKRHFEVPKDTLGEQVFLIQLIDIGDVEADDIERLTTLFYHQLLTKNNVDDWLREGDITSIDVEALEDDAITSWTNKHRQAFRKTVAKEDVNDAAQGVVDRLRDERLSVASQEMDRPFSNGEYYDLCERRKIGWRNDWKEKY
jgi:hypothetical protein